MALKVKKSGNEVGTEGNVITPIDGEQIKTQEEMDKQYADDFGDDIAEMIDGAVIEEGYDDVSFKVEQTNEEGETEVIVPAPQRTAQQMEPLEEEPEEVQQQTQAPTSKKEETVDLSNYVAKEDFDKLQRDMNLLQGDYNKLKESANAGMLNISDQELNVLRKIKSDYETTPLGLIVENYYKGDLDFTKIVPNAKAPQEYMPEGEQFDSSDAYTQGTPSFAAREQYENAKSALVKQYADAAEYISSNSKVTRSEEEIKKESAAMEEKLFAELASKVPQATKHKDSFLKWLQGQSNLYMLAWIPYTQAVNSAIKKKKGVKNQPLVSVASAQFSEGGREVADVADSEMVNEFGYE